MCTCVEEGASVNSINKPSFHFFTGLCTGYVDVCFLIWLCDTMNTKEFCYTKAIVTSTVIIFVVLFDY